MNYRLLSTNRKAIADATNDFADATNVLFHRQYKKRICKCPSLE
jgi:hypothetical protein